MEILIIFAVIFIIGYVIYNASTKHATSSLIKKSPYMYQAKESFVTKSEMDFFKMLVNVASDRYYIFPQAHLSAILNHKVTGQDWKSAFRHINGKSVDYVLCDRKTLKPVYAVELDDYTHEYASRKDRDKEVERMLKSAGVPLVRFSDYKTLDQEAIAKKFFESANTAI